MFKRKSIYLTQDQYTDELVYLMGCLQKNNVKSVDLLFGFAWGNFYGDWKTLPVDPCLIFQKIKEVEIKTDCQFYDHDLFIEVKKSHTTIHFCHEHDIHLDYEV